MIGLPQVFTLETLFKSIACGMQLAASLFQFGNNTF
jgi:hypothetical protein